MNDRKIFLLDTSVLLYDMQSIHSFDGNDVVIPLVVLDELDRFKDKPGLLGESARYVNRFMDELRKLGRLDQAIDVPGTSQTVRVELNTDYSADMPSGLAKTAGDNKIIATALYIDKKHPDAKIKVITKDINMRVKCDALGISAEDYFKDHIELSADEAYLGTANIEIGSDAIDKFYSEGSVSTKEDLFPHQFVVATSSDGKSLIGKHAGGKILPVDFNTNSMIPVEARNKEQKFAMSMLCDPNIPLVSITGIAGSGKTFLTLMAGLSGIYDDHYKRIVITRSIEPVGRDLGYLPGDVDEKMGPWLAPIMDNFRFAFNDMTYFDLFRQKGQIEIAPLSYIRGRTFNDSFVIVDEAQNATIHELKTIITRIGRGSKIILLGDTDQVDTPYIDSSSNGLTITIEKFKNSKNSGHIHLTKGQRSALATEASSLL